MFSHHTTSRALLLIFIFLASCGGGGGGGAPAPTPTYSVGGTVTGLSGTVVLQNSGGNNLSIITDGSFAFTTKLTSGTKYKVTVLTQPASQTCTASTNTGTVSGANVTNVSVVCSTITYTISGTVSNLVGSGLVLQNNGTDNLAINGNGSFTFSKPVASGAGYAVTVFTQPAGRCAVTSGAGTATANVTGVTVSCVPAFAYVANFGSNDMSAYTVNGSTGALTQVNCVAGCNGNNFSAGTSPTAVAVAPLGKFAYAANFGSADISAYRIDGSTGALISVATVTVGGSSPVAIAVDPTGKFVYAVNSGGISAYTLHLTTGALTSVGTASAGTSPNSIAIHPNGNFAYVTNVGGSVLAYNINASTGALTANGSAVAAGSGAQAVAIAPSGKFAYVANASAHTVSAYTISASGGLTVVGSVAAGTGTTAIAVDPSSKFVYAANYVSNDISAYSINTATGALTLLDCGGGSSCNNFMFRAGTHPASINVDPSGLSVYVANDGGNVSAYLMDNISGMLTPIAGSPFVAGTKPASVVTTTTQ